ncbi:hypothetical protein Hlac_3582 (plasmid) [Halorubrum lacusprofundi ATCC 49239]|uniref:Uncharacterized protein n=1 Tax=Halorubrum lacusprofundi (strain ATCC 49239 / DSM 5036 / JCM 8891 / ACAM 34) TaxID=416348 RepID=B9LX98_HALLT|nr:hypothetical protein Hlac_3582 [Halorubrum lacusprofundi ATCC 49239]
MSAYGYEADEMFQSRAGFSECLDTLTATVSNHNQTSFNPVLGFLSVSTDADRSRWMTQDRVSIPCWVF